MTDSAEFPDPITTAAADAAKGLARPVYEDLLQPSTREIGKGLQTVAKTVHVALAPVAALVWGYERISEYLGKRLTEKLSSTPTEQIVTPPPNVAGPALEALRFVGTQEDLREMYASLLASAMDSRFASTAHPAFVEFIKQLTPDEARILRCLADGKYRPLIVIRADDANGVGGIDVARNVSMLDEEAKLEHPALAASYLDNLVRLGLVEIPRVSSLTSPGVYDEIESHPNVKELRNMIDSTEGRRSSIVRSFVATTSLGQQFIAACVVDRNDVASTASA